MPPSGHKRALKIVFAVITKSGLYQEKRTLSHQNEPARHGKGTRVKDEMVSKWFRARCRVEACFDNKFMVRKFNLLFFTAHDWILQTKSIKEKKSFIFDERKVLATLRFFIKDISSYGDIYEIMFFEMWMTCFTIFGNCERWIMSWKFWSLIEEVVPSILFCTVVFSRNNIDL